MKTKLSILSLFVLSMLFISCDSNKSKVSDVAKKFVQAAINNDKATIYELYPEIRDYPDLQIAKDLTDKSISVDFNETDSTYIANLSEQMKLIVEVSDSNTIKIINSYNVFLLDSISNELAIKTGTPINQLPDLTIGWLFDDSMLGCLYDADNNHELFFKSYMYFLKEANSDAVNGNLYDHDAQIAWGGGYNKYVRLEIPVSNGGQTFVKGDDYTVEIICYETSTEERIGTSIERGVDLAPGETFVFITNQDELYRYANNNNMTYGMDFHFKLSNTGMLVKYGQFSGNEYNKYEELRKTFPVGIGKIKIE